MADWIQWFCTMEGHDFFCEVDRSFIESRFNLYGLNSEVRNFSDCLNIILDYVNTDSSSDDWNREEWSRKECMDLYGRIHARFLLTSRGQQLMMQKFRNEDFGHCPLVSCKEHPVLPVGLSDKAGEHRVMVFCPNCQDLYIPDMILAARYVDGAYFGTSFPHFLLMCYPESVPDRIVAQHVPTVFGYRLHSSSAAHVPPEVRHGHGHVWSKVDDGVMRLENVEQAAEAKAGLCKGAVNSTLDTKTKTAASDQNAAENQTNQKAACNDGDGKRSGGVEGKCSKGVVL